MAKKNYLITGGSGLIGSYFVKNFPLFDSKAMLFAPMHEEMDISNTSSLKRYFKKIKPNAVVHFAAVRDANKAEEERGFKRKSAWRTNVIGTKNLAAICSATETYFIHISTDYVFSGHENKKGPYIEDDIPDEDKNLLSWYGLTKREAEKFIKQKNINSAIIRISNITMPANPDPKLDYVGKILWLYDQKKLYPMFHDQYLTLTHIPKLVEAISLLLKKKFNGVYHIASSNLCTPHELSNYLIEKARGVKGAVSEISIDSFLANNPRRYPKFGGLRSEKTAKKLRIEFDSWQKIVDKFLK